MRAPDFGVLRRTRLVGTAATAQPSRGVVALALSAITMVVFGRCIILPFASIDDATYVTDNASVLGGLSRGSLRWAFVTTHASNWHPLTWLSHMLDVQLFGPAPAGHHAVNVALHAANAAIFFLAWDRMTGARARSAFVALLFALHPLRVESVAWIAERKDVLSALFAMVTLLLYARHAERPSFLRLGATTLAFVLGLLAKPMLVTLPFLLLLLDVWPLRRPARVGWARLVAEKLPMFAASAASAFVTLAVQEASRDLTLSFGARLSNAALAYVTYLGRTAWPLDLAIFYPRRDVSPLVGAACAALVGLLAFAAVRERERRPWVPVGLAWFLGMLVPTVGLVTVGDQGSADRYTYLPSLGLFVAAVWTLADMAAQGSRWVRRAITPAVVLILALSVTLVWRQIGFFRTNLALWQRAYDVGGESRQVEWCLSSANFVEAHDFPAAAEHCRKAVRLAPDRPFYLKTCGERFALLGLDAEALDALRAATRFAPDDAIGWFELATVLARRGELEEAERGLARAVQLAPDVQQPREALNAVRSALRNRGGATRPPVIAPR